MIVNQDDHSVIGGSNDNDSIYNTGSYVTINGGDGEDFIRNEGLNVIIDSGSGDDSIVNYGVSSIIDGGEGNDEIGNEGKYSSLYGGAGDDSIYNIGSNVTISAGEGADSIVNSGASVTIGGGSGDDTILNLKTYYGTPDNVSISGDDGDDYIENVGLNVTIDGGAGDDTIQNTSSNVTISAGEGADSIVNKSSRVTIEAGAGDDTILNLKTYYGTPDNVSISGDDGDDYIENVGLNVTIDGGAGDDTIQNTSSNVTISAGEGADSIVNKSSRVTIEAGAGDDSITNDGNSVIFKYTGGNDVITGFNVTSSLQVGDGTTDFHVSKSGNDVIVSIEGGEGSITLKDAAYLFDSSGSDEEAIDQNIKYVQNMTSDTIITGTDGIDDILNFQSASNVTIDGGLGNDRISLSGGGNNISVTGGKGDDSISIANTTNATINVGKGKDKISVYANSMNSFNVINFGKDDVITFSPAYVSITALEASGDSIVASVLSTLERDLVDKNITIGGVDFNYVTLENNNIIGLGRNSLISGTDGNDFIFNDESESTIKSGAGKDYVFNSGSQVTVDSGAGDDNIDNEGSTVTINGGQGNDSITNGSKNVTVYGGAGDDSITNNGSQVFIASGAGDDNITNNASQVLIAGGAGDDNITNKGSHVTIDTGEGDDNISNTGSNVTFQYRGGNDVIKGYNETSSLQVGDGSVAYDLLKSGNDIIVSIEGGEGFITLKDAADLFDTSDEDDEEDPEKEGAYRHLAQRLSDTIITGTDGNDGYLSQGGGSNITISTGAGKDRITLSNGLQNVSVNGGTDNDFISIAYTSNATIDVGKGKDIISVHANSMNSFDVTNFGEGDVINFFPAYVSITALESSGDLVIASLLSTLERAPIDKKVTIGGLDLNYVTWENTSIVGTGRNTLVSGTDGNDTITNNNDKVTIVGGAGNDSITNRGGNVLFQYKAGDGNDLITGFNETSSLSLSGSAYSSVTSGDDIILTVDDGTITLSGASTLETVNLILAHTEDNDNIQNSLSGVYINALGGDDTVKNDGDNVTIDGDAGNDTIQNSGQNVLFQYTKSQGNDLIQGFNTTSTLQIGEGRGTYSTQASGADLLVNAGKGTVTLEGAATLSTVNIDGRNPFVNGTDGADQINNTLDGATITAGAGDDSITNSGQNVLFQYTDGDGNDFIQGFTANSTLSISGAKYSGQTSGNDIILTVNDGTITLSDAATLDNINVVTDYEDEDEKIDNDSYGDKVDTVDATSVTLEEETDEETGNIIVTKTALGDTTNENGEPEVILSFDREGESTVPTGTAGSGKVLELTDNRTEDQAENKTLVLNFNEKSAEDRGLDSYSGLDLSDAKGEVNIIGSDHNFEYIKGSKNGGVLTASKKGSSLEGGDGNDQLYGSTGKDSFVQSGGTDIVNKMRSGQDVVVVVRDELKRLAETMKRNVRYIDNHRLNYEAVDATLEDGTININESSTEPSTEPSMSIAGGSATVDFGDGSVMIFNNIDGDSITFTDEDGNIESFSLLEEDYEANGWSLDSNIAIYKIDGEEVVTISGVTSIEGLEIDEENKIITVSTTSLDKNSTVTINGDGYELKLGEGVPESKEEPTGWTQDGNTTIYKTTSTTAGYKLSDDKKTISYAEAVAGEIKVELSGVEGNPTFDETGKIIQLSATNLKENASVVSNAGEYEFEIDSGDYSGITFGGSSSKESITNNGSDISFDLGDGLDIIKNNANGVSIDGGQ